MSGPLYSPPWTSWVHPRMQVSWALQWSFVVTVSLLALFVALYLWHRRLPGPLTAVERSAAAAGPAWKSLSRLLVLGFAALAVLGALALVWDVGRPTALVLHSRARSTGPVDMLVPAGGVRVLDLGPVVDEILARCLDADAEKTFGASCRGSLPAAGLPRARLAAAVGKALLGVGAADLPARGGSTASVPPARDVSVDVAMIESIELAVVDFWVARTHPFRVRVAAQASVGLSSWTVARHVLATRGWTLEVLDAPDVTAPGLHIRKLAGGRVNPDGKVSLWAIVDGRVSNKTVLEFPVLTAGGSGVVLGGAAAELLEDGLDSRIVLARGHATVPGRCAGMLPLVARRPLSFEAGPELPLECIDPEVVPTLSSADASSWKARLDRVRAELATEPLLALEDELESLGASVPQVRAGSTAPVLVTRGGDQVRGPTLLVIASTLAQANRLADEAMTDSPAPYLPPVLRVASTSEGPATRFSWASLPVRRGQLRSAGDALVSGQARLGEWPSKARASGPQAAVVWGGATGPRAQRYVVIRVPEGAWTELPEQGAPAEPDAQRALTRSLARAAAWVLSGTVDVLDAGAGDALATETVGPLLAGADIEALAGAAEPTRDVGSVVLIGVYLVFSLGIAAFALRGAQADVLRGPTRD